tara:strand:- start:1706 stop:2155 length:450 start_codon:yes stop_codon:yes gene_type:complete
MTADLRWYYSGAEVENPVSLQATPVSVILKNVGSTAARNIGFYLALATVDPVAEVGTVYPSTRGPVIDLYDILRWGDLGTGGFVITQTVSQYVTDGRGGSADSPLSFVLGATNTDGLEPNEEKVIQVLVELPAGEPSHRKYVNLEVVYS